MGYYSRALANMPLNLLGLNLLLPHLAEGALQGKILLRDLWTSSNSGKERLCRDSAFLLDIYEPSATLWHIVSAVAVH